MPLGSRQLRQTGGSRRRVSWIGSRVCSGRVEMEIANGMDLLGVGRSSLFTPPRARCRNRFIPSYRSIGAVFQTAVEPTLGRRTAGSRRPCRVSSWATVVASDTLAPKIFCECPRLVKWVRVDLDANVVALGFHRSSAYSACPRLCPTWSYRARWVTLRCQGPRPIREPRIKSLGRAIDAVRPAATSITMGPRA